MLLVSLSFPCFSLLYVYKEVNSQLIPENHKLSCSYNETQTLACLNGGSCFAVYVEDRVVQCACNRKYIGRRCEMIDPEIIFDDSETGQKEVAIGLISGFAAIIFLFIVFLIVGCVWFVKRSACTGICNTA